MTAMRGLEQRLSGPTPHVPSVSNRLHQPSLAKSLRAAAAGVVLAASGLIADLRPGYAESVSPNQRTELVLPPHPEAVAIEGGMFYNETNGGAPEDQGYFVRGPMWNTYQSLGGVGVWGYPVSREFIDDVGRVSQAFQRGIVQLTMGPGGRVDRVEYANILDELSRQGKDGWLASFRQIPPSRDWSGDAGESWEKVVARHLAVLDEDPAIKQAFLSNPRWLEQYGLPMALALSPNEDQIVLRGQRAAIQRWLVNTPWARAGQTIVALGGSIAVEAGGIIPAGALALERFGAPVVAQGGGETRPGNFELTIQPTDSSPEQLARGTRWINETLANMRNSGNDKLMDAANYIIQHNPKQMPTAPAAQKVAVWVTDNEPYDGPIRFVVGRAVVNGKEVPTFALQVLAERLGKLPSSDLLAQTETYRHLKDLNGFVVILQQRGQSTNYAAANGLWKGWSDPALIDLGNKNLQDTKELLRQLQGK